MEEESKWKKYVESPYWSVLIWLLLAIIFFFLGRISKIEEKREPVKVISGSSVEKTTPVTVTSGDSRVVASKNGSKYHYPWCAGAQKISAKNLVTFASAEEAKTAGLTPAGNCKGLK